MALASLPAYLTMLIPMQKPSWIDILALAAVIVGAVALRWHCQIELHPRVGNFLPPEKAFINVARNVRHVVEEVTPAVFGFAVVGFARVLREPAPRRRLLFRQPGVAACAAMVAALAAGAVNTAIWAVRRWEFSEAWLNPGPAMAITLGARHLSYCVLAVWAFLAVGGSWTPGRNWVNRLGCVIGSLVVVDSVLRCLP
jgi:hypothetical protein